MTLRSKTLSVSIDQPPAEVYAFVSDATRLPTWAAGLGRAVRKSGDGWTVETSEGSLGLRFVETNELGVLDHVVTLPTGEAILNPMRVIPNGSGSEVLFTLFQRSGMSDAEFARDAELVARDLVTLKGLLEARR